MKAMILAAGYGSRLGDLTKGTPKCLLTINGKTLIEYVIDNLKTAGVGSIVVNLHHLADQVTSYFKAKNNFGLEVNFSYEEKILGTGGGLKAAAAHFSREECFIMHNADVYSEVDLKTMSSSHLQNGAVATLAVLNRSNERHLIFTGEGELCGWKNKEREQWAAADNQKHTLQRLSFAGIQILSPKILESMMDQTGEFSIISTYLKAAESGYKVMAYPIDGSYWLDVGKPETLRELQEKLRS
ncbi:MAG: nucleotidyltransferase family protein [Deltaproteobacteria bacterium]|nr:nucleotidyltransferase family protein [Deltaproteobacteria bacterium]